MRRLRKSVAAYYRGTEAPQLRTQILAIETHPIQYHVPVYRYLQQSLGIAISVVYGSDFSIVGYHDEEFGTTFAWDTDLVSGYSSVFLSRTSDGGATNDKEVKTNGLATVLARLRPRAVLCVGYSPRFHRDALHCAYRTGVPILFRGETTDHAQHRGMLKALVRDMMLRALYRKCAACMFVGQRSWDHFCRLGVDKDRLFFSPYCVDATSFHADERARMELRHVTRHSLGLRPNDFVIAFSGKLSGRKAPDQLIQAVRGMPANVRQHCVVLMIGEGELSQSLEQLAQSSPVVAIKRAGFQPQKSLSRFYHASDILVLPSLYSETWGLVVNEALHHGVPAVVSDAVGCAPDLVECGRTGEVFQAGSVPELTAALLRSINLAGREDIRFECRSKADKYSTENAAEGIAAAYRSVVEQYGA